jgi:Caspase domain
MPTYHKFALFLASNYPGTTFSLGGCLLDAEKVRSWLVTRRGFSSVATLYNQAMTKAAVFAALDDMVTRSHAVAASGQIPAFFLGYSGHGTRVWNANTRAFEGRQVTPPNGLNDSDGDEAIVPQDVSRSGLILDDDLNTRLVQRLHPSTQLFVLTDCCNSGSNLDLSYQGLSKIESAGDASASIIHLAASRDSQLAAETSTGGGRATARFLQVMASPPTTVSGLTSALGDLSSARNQQQPQLSVSKAKMVQGNLFPWLVSNVTTEPGVEVLTKALAGVPVEVIAIAPRAPVIPASAQRSTMTIQLPLDVMRSFRLAQ